MDFKSTSKVRRLRSELKAMALIREQDKPAKPANADSETHPVTVVQPLRAQRNSGKTPQTPSSDALQHTPPTAGAFPLVRIGSQRLGPHRLHLEVTQMPAEVSQSSAHNTSGASDELPQVPVPGYGKLVRRKPEGRLPFYKNSESESSGVDDSTASYMGTSKSAGDSNEVPKGTRSRRSQKPAPGMWSMWSSST